MGFTVYLPGGIPGSEFEAYLRLLRQQGIDLGTASRVPDEGSNGCWLHVWQVRSEAEAFARELRKRTGALDWAIKETTDPPSEGPLGPLLIQLTRRSDGLVFALHPLSQTLILSAFPTRETPSRLSQPSPRFIDLAMWTSYQASGEGLPGLLADIIPDLTGLAREQLAELGYLVIDTEANHTVFAVPPAQLTRT